MSLNRALETLAGLAGRPLDVRRRERESGDVRDTGADTDARPRRARLRARDRPRDRARGRAGVGARARQALSEGAELDRFLTLTDTRLRRARYGVVSRFSPNPNRPDHLVASIVALAEQTNDSRSTPPWRRPVPTPGPHRRGRRPGLPPRRRRRRRRRRDRLARGRARDLRPERGARRGRRRRRRHGELHARRRPGRPGARRPRRPAEIASSAEALRRVSLSSTSCCRAFSRLRRAGSRARGGRAAVLAVVQVHAATSSIRRSR